MASVLPWLQTRVGSEQNEDMKNRLLSAEDLI
jgi:hypothetical protein